MDSCEGKPRVCVIGPGWHFTSGISHYTCRLAGALAEHAQVSAVLLRGLVPRALYPGRSHIGAGVAAIDYDERVDVYDGVNWYWGLGMLGAVRHLRAALPHAVLFQWWTGAAAHSYLLLASVARSLGASVLIEFHEAQDPGEVSVPLAARYTRRMLAGLVRRADHFLMHSEYDHELLTQLLGLSGRSVAVVPHGPFDHYAVERTPSPDGAFRLLFFGLIRPYKGVEYLISAFNRLRAEEAAGFRLTVVGETWEGCTAPVRLIEDSPHRDRITLVNRYVTDEEAKAYFAGADALVLPYLRSSASGPLHIAMSNGMPVVVSAVGGLVEAVRDYAGALLVEPADVDALLYALRRVQGMGGTARFPNPHSWERNVQAVLGTLRPSTERELP
ncbi:glycosyltransferase [Streptomyces sp. NPDC059680]|uniref:glycosyltransferase n=1 Tax=Streptomyces sp. NPDC059680 TaxID=3346904 RepID=UPI0036CDFA64